MVLDILTDYIFMRGIIKEVHKMLKINFCFGILTLFSIILFFIACNQKPSHDVIKAKEEKNEQSLLIESSFERLVYHTFYQKEFLKLVTTTEPAMVGSVVMVVPKTHRKVINTEIVEADLIYYFDDNSKLITKEYFYRGTNTPIEHVEIEKDK